jgi:hypothetical protein
MEFSLAHHAHDKVWTEMQVHKAHLDHFTFVREWHKPCGQSIQSNESSHCAYAMLEMLLEMRPRNVNVEMTK